MKRSIVLNLLILILISMQSISAGGVGISPAYHKEFFEPNLTKTFKFHSFSSDPNIGINTYVSGDLSKYVTLSKQRIIGDGKFTATINLPDKIKKPGTHTILIGAIESVEDSSGTVGGIAAIQSRIDIIVPYPGKYAESKFIINNINEGEKTKYEITSDNLGSQDLKINSRIELYKNNMTEKILTETFKESTLSPKETLTIKGELKTQDLTPGEYEAVAIIDWGNQESINKTFKVGEFIIEIIDYDYQFEKGKINPFNIQIQNKWNKQIPEVFASVSITDNGKVVGDFKTVSIQTAPWETKNITGYLDTSNLEPKRYTARIAIWYGDDFVSKLVAIYIKNPSIQIHKTYVAVTAIVALLLIIIITYLIYKIKKLTHKSEKKK